MYDAIPSSPQPSTALSGACRVPECRRPTAAAAALRPVRASEALASHQISGHLFRRWSALRRDSIWESPTKMCFSLPLPSFMQSAFMMASAGPVICRASSTYPLDWICSRYFWASQSTACNILNTGSGKPLAPRSRQCSSLIIDTCCWAGSTSPSLVKPSSSGVWRPVWFEMEAMKPLPCPSTPALSWPWPLSWPVSWPFCTAATAPICEISAAQLIAIDTPAITNGSLHDSGGNSVNGDRTDLESE
mmetsp:Transcript_123517/g.331751  ORF Transcript_123517/g.331751 Transcript_123517/m.331751 type:complete len:247 (+) Transcript_123517:441-1181(+)